MSWPRRCVILGNSVLREKLSSEGEDFGEAAISKSFRKMEAAQAGPRHEAGREDRLDTSSGACRSSRVPAPGREATWNQKKGLA